MILTGKRIKRKTSAYSIFVLVIVILGILAIIFPCNGENGLQLYLYMKIGIIVLDVVLFAVSVFFIDKNYYKPANRKNRRDIATMEPIILLILAVVCIAILGYAVTGITGYVKDSKGDPAAVTLESYNVRHVESSRRLPIELWILEGTCEGEAVSIDITSMPENELRIIENNEGGDIDVIYYPNTSVLIKVGDYKF